MAQHHDRFVQILLDLERKILDQENLDQKNLDPKTDARNETQADPKGRETTTRVPDRLTPREERSSARASVSARAPATRRRKSDSSSR